MLILGVETSGRSGTIALWRDGVPLTERLLAKAGRRHAQSLVPEIVGALKQFDVRVCDCGGLAVSIGPGSFTGLRVGVVFAKTFAYATGCRLVAIDTFLGIAENSPPDVGDVFVIADAQRGDLYVGHYRRNIEGAFQPQQGIEIVDAEVWCQARSTADVVSGPGLEKYESDLANRCRILDPACRLPKASEIARLGERLLEAGERTDPWSLEPLYRRKSAAEEKWDATGSCRS